MIRHLRSGWKPSPFDGRDRLFAPTTARLQSPLPSSVQLAHPIEPRDQARVSCCVSCAVVACMEILDAKVMPLAELSPLFHYFKAPKQGRAREVTLRDGLQTAVVEGICRRPLHDPPFTSEGARTVPSAAAEADASRQKVATFDPVTWRRQYESLDPRSIAAWKRALREEHPLAVGFWLTDAYWQMADGETVHPDVRGLPSQQSGHAVAISGYDDSADNGSGAFLVKDSRGTSFGARGEWWFPYSFLKLRLVHESWVLKRITY